MNKKIFFEQLRNKDKNNIFFECFKKHIKSKLKKKIKKIKELKIGKVYFLLENNEIKGLARISGFTLNKVKCKVKYIKNFILDKDVYKSDLYIPKIKNNKNYDSIKPKNLMPQNGVFYVKGDITQPYFFEGSKKTESLFYYE